MATREVWIDKDNGQLRYVDGNGQTRTLPRMVMATNVTGRTAGEVWISTGGTAGINWIGRSTPNSGLHHYRAAYPDWYQTTTLPDGSAHINGEYIYIARGGNLYRQDLKAPDAPEPDPEPDPGDPGGGGGVTTFTHYSTSGNTVTVYFFNGTSSNVVDTISPACGTGEFASVTSPFLHNGSTYYGGYTCVFIPP